MDVFRATTSPSESSPTSTDRRFNITVHQSNVNQTTRTRSSMTAGTQIFSFSNHNGPLILAPRHGQRGVLPLDLVAVDIHLWVASSTTSGLHSLKVDRSRR